MCISRKWGALWLYGSWLPGGLRARGSTGVPRRGSASFRAMELHTFEVLVQLPFGDKCLRLAPAFVARGGYIAAAVDQAILTTESNPHFPTLLMSLSTQIQTARAPAVCRQRATAAGASGEGSNDGS